MFDFILFVLLILPLVHFIHELGHVAVARLFHIPDTKIVLGMGKELCSFHLLGTKVQFNTIYILGGYSTNEQAGELAVWKRAIISFGGPFLSIVSAIVAFPFLTTSNVNVLLLFIFFSLWIGITNLIPFKIGHKQSDGWIIFSSFIVKKNRRKEQ